MRHRIWFFFFLIPALLVISFVVWASSPLGPMQEVFDAGGEQILVQERDGLLVARPASGAAESGLIFYPGGRVEYRSYLPLATKLAEKGHLVAIIRMPFNLAIFGINRAEDVMQAHPDIEYWAIGGHSLGGAMASQFVFEHPGRVDGLILLAAYPAGSSSLANQSIDVLSIFGENDGLATKEKIEASKTLLPAKTGWLEIKGGNHAQFGWYGEQPGDGQAVISREQQQDQVVTAIDDFLRAR